MVREKILSLSKKDFEVSFFSGSGAGGQHRNKHQNCVRIFHRASGVMTVGQDGRDRHQNQKAAFLRVTKHKKFKHWIKLEIAKSSVGIDELNKRVDAQMIPSNIKVEYRPFATIGETILKD